MVSNMARNERTAHIYTNHAKRLFCYLIENQPGHKKTIESTPEDIDLSLLMTSFDIVREYFF